MMISDPVPLTREVVLIGGGHTHALVLRSWGMRPVPGARLTVINPAPSATYTGMLPGHIAGHYTREELDLDVLRLARFAGARLVLGTVTGIDPEARRVRIAGRADIAYDIASIDIGITSDMPEIEGFSDHAVAAKPLGPYAARWAQFVAKGGGPVVVIGGGIAGIELALAMAHRLRGSGTGAVSVIEAGTLLSAATPATRRRLRAALDRAGIAVHEGATAARIAADHVALADGRRVPAALTVGAAGPRPWPWLEKTGLELNAGYIAVDAQLRSLSHPDVYACGDCAHLSHAPRPKAGVYAVRAAPVLARNLRADLTGSARRDFRPQRDYLKLASLGGKRALADRSGIVAEGDWLWHWKDRIDRRFMARLRDLPAPPAPKVPARAAQGVREEMGEAGRLCGGCGAKVGPAALSGALGALTVTRGDVIAGAGDDAAILKIGGIRQAITTDHLRGFVEDPWLMARIAALHAMGDIWAMGGAPQAALPQITLPRMSATLQARWMAEILDGAQSAFGPAGADIVGGHSTQGSELTIGYTVTGLLPGDPVTLSGAQVGDRIVLTRPIGSGVLLAGEMALAARGPDIGALYATLGTPQGDAAGALSGASAMTDVTGFGLAGHLGGILRASGVAARLFLDTVPLYPGALDLARRGIRSSLFAQNRAAAPVAANRSDPAFELLFDPQTAGGFLATLPADRADAALARLTDLGHRAAIVGEIVPGSPAITVI